MNKPAELKLQTVVAWINGKAEAEAPAGRHGDILSEIKAALSNAYNVSP